MTSLVDEFEELFDDDGLLAEPTMRGSANLDVQDYAQWDGFSSILADEIQEQIPQTPGFNPGAAPAPDVQGTSSYTMMPDDDADDPALNFAPYGSHPWGAGAGEGYRPYAQARTGMELRALGGAEDNDTRESKPMRSNALSVRTGEVIDTGPEMEAEVGPWADQWHGSRNQQPSNAEIDPLTEYDRTSFERTDSTQSVIGTGIFGMEAGVTWRPRDGIFAQQYAMPAYLAEEDELDVQQSEMWDPISDNWRVVQPTASGVSLARRVPELRPPPPQLARHHRRPPPQLQMHAAGPRSHIEAFGRQAAKLLLEEARLRRAEADFLEKALESLGAGAAQKAKQVADRMVELGYPQASALEDVVAHMVMHAAVKDLTDVRKAVRTLLPRLDFMSQKVVEKGDELRRAAARHIKPLAKNGNDLKNDLGALYNSPAARGMGEASVEDEPSAEALAPVENGNGNGGLFSTRNLMIGAGVGVAAFLLYRYREPIKKNIQKLTKPKRRSRRR